MHLYIVAFSEVAEYWKKSSRVGVCEGVDVGSVDIIHTQGEGENGILSNDLFIAPSIDLSQSHLIYPSIHMHGWASHLLTY